MARPNERVIVVPVDNSDDSANAFKWLLANFYRTGDEIHLVHIIPRLKLATGYALPAIDLAPSFDRTGFQEAIERAEKFIVDRFLAAVPHDMELTPIVHIVKSETDTDSVGHVICKKADDMHAACIIMGNHNKKGIKEFLLGSVSQFVIHHSKVPVTIVKS